MRLRFVCPLFLFALNIALAQPALQRSSIVTDLVGSSPQHADLQTDLLQEGPMGGGEKKSVFLAVTYSLLLPGMGELYAGDYSTGKYFTIAEGGLWIALAGVNYYASWLEDDAHSFAAQHAGFSLAGKSDQFFIDVGNFQSAQAYNDQARRDRDYNQLYNVQAGMNWNWDNAANQNIYRDRRVSSENMFNNARFVAAAIAVNHVISAISAARVAVGHNKSADQTGSIDVHARVIGALGRPDGIQLCFSRAF